MNFIDSVILNNDNGSDEAKIESYSIVKHIEARTRFENGYMYYELISSDFTYDDLAVFKQLMDAEKINDKIAVIVTYTGDDTQSVKEVFHPVGFTDREFVYPDGHESIFSFYMGSLTQGFTGSVSFNRVTEEVSVDIECSNFIQETIDNVNMRVTEVKYDANNDRLIDANTGDSILFDDLWVYLHSGHAVVVTAPMGADGMMIRTSNFYFGLTDSGDRFIAATTVVFADAVTMINTCVSFIATSDGYAKLANSQANIVTGNPLE